MNVWVPFQGTQAGLPLPDWLGADCMLWPFIYHDLIEQSSHLIRWERIFFLNLSIDFNKISINERLLLLKYTILDELDIWHVCGVFKSYEKKLKLYLPAQKLTMIQELNFFSKYSLCYTYTSEFSFWWKSAFDIVSRKNFKLLSAAGIFWLFWSRNHIFDQWDYFMPFCPGNYDRACILSLRFLAAGRTCQHERPHSLFFTDSS